MKKIENNKILLSITYNNKSYTQSIKAYKIVLDFIYSNN